MDFCPSEVALPLPAETLGFQLFNGATSIYGQSRIYEAQGLLLNIENIQNQGFIYFEAISDPQARGKQRPFMLAVISPKINYFESLRIKDVLRKFASEVKSGQKWDIQKYWQRISKILTTPVL
jgi:hypothetical protein